ncbi:MAG: M23 family metallopeptidase [Moorea sp. SIO2B7]|nr:M23 family metallopeptidase [Moorena sp. SIO2B7]
MRNRFFLTQNSNRLLSRIFAPFILAVSTQAIPAVAQLDFGTGGNTQESACPPPILSRMKRHWIADGETIESIARDNNILPETLIRLNPILASGTAPVGKDILIPPFNGIKIEIPQGATWADLEAAYGVRADVLFEINGCQNKPTVVFLPGVNWGPRGRSNVDSYSGLSGYPLPAIANIGLAYGWQNNPTNQRRKFHSGIDLLAPLETPILSAEAGLVVFVGQQGNYGNLVVVNHGGGRQTRYAHLSSVQVIMGQQVQTGDILGKLGKTGSPDIDPPHLHFEVRQNLPLGWVAQDPEIHLTSKVKTGQR